MSSPVPPVPPSSPERRLRRSRILNVVLAAIAAFLLLVVVAQWQGQQQAGAADAPTPAPSSSAAAAPAPAPSEHPLVRRDPGDPMAFGAVDAPVVLVEWTDFRCPYCALFTRDTFPTLRQEYVDTGEVRIEVHDVAFFGEQSAEAAVAARAAARQDRFADYLTAVYAAAPARGHAELPRERLIELAETAGIPDMARFTADLDDPELHAAVQESTSTAQSLGVNSVPFFLAGGKALAGAQPIDAFRAFLDEAVAAAG